LGRPEAEATALREEFFGGDVLDRELLDVVRTLRPGRRTGLISNAWADTRDYIVRNRFDDAFDLLVISAEVGLLKPDPLIYDSLHRDIPAAARWSMICGERRGALAAGIRHPFWTHQAELAEAD
jgi:FMN phosphatase YigB (HAD superfamily)